MVSKRTVSCSACGHTTTATEDENGYYNFEEPGWTFAAPGGSYCPRCLEKVTGARPLGILKGSDTTE